MRKITAMWLCTLMFVSSAFVVVDVTEDAEGKEVVRDGATYVISAPFKIDSDADFATSSNVTGGDGSPGSPWIIENYDINGTDHGYCIYIGNTTEYFVVRDCYLHDAGGIKDWPYYYDSGLIMYNTQNGSITNNVVNSNSYDGIFLVYSSNNNDIENNTVLYNINIGIYTYSSQFNNIMNNIASNNVRGITLSYSSNTTVTNNNVSSNDLTGIDLFQACEYNVLTNNTISLNADCGVYLYSSGAANNAIYNNSFINNAIQAIDNGIANSWDNGYPSGGNYWSDYTGVDFNSTPSQDVPPPDGIGDTPYTDIQGGSGAQDNYPLMEPWGMPEEPTLNITLSQGWNLISLPLIQSNESINAVLSSISGKWDYVQAYNATDPDHWKTYSIYKPGQLNDLLSLDHTIGFWINITEPGVTLTCSGLIPGSTSIPLYSGWNLVGYPTFNETVNVGDALWGTGADCVMVCDTSEPYNIKEVGPGYIMKPGEGYWVHVVADSVWVVDW
ncbi:MAG: right-handed parallel beta-helix repeat-containing protein [Thermoplasmata archaeon]|nr:right-handed parallel beta-helix repeat-containing protein [Thermoplasmata archaeon]